MGLRWLQANGQALAFPDELDLISALVLEMTWVLLSSWAFQNQCPHPIMGPPPPNTQTLVPTNQVTKWPQSSANLKAPVLVWKGKWGERD